MVLKASVDIPGLSIDGAYERFVKEIRETLSKKGVVCDLSKNGELKVGSKEFAHVTSWDPPQRIALDWWQPETRGKEFVTKLQISFAAIDKPEGTRVTIEHSGWEDVLEKTGAEPIDWFTDVIAGHILAATTPGNYGEWLIDRVARRPSGTMSKQFYSNPVYHKPNFTSILDHLKLTEDDNLVEIGCGGGYFLAEALKSGCNAAAIDHSPEMIEVSIHQNLRFIEKGRLNILEGTAEALPFGNEQFTCAVSTGVFGFISHPSTFFSEVFRVLKSSGRFVLFTGSREMKGTPAAPDPIAEDYITWYSDDELVGLATDAGFSDVSVEHPDLKEFAIQAGVPAEALDLFTNRKLSQLLLATKK